MMRVTTLYASTAATTAGYYTRYLTEATGELPGEWLGNQADRLGLHGEVTTDALQALLSGCDPTTGATLGHPLVDRTKSNGTVIRAVAGFDATLSAPKSLSVLWAITGDDGLAECHDVAVRAVAAHLERYGATTRVRSNGTRLHLDTHGLTMAAFRQTARRARRRDGQLLDRPQLPR
jgi:conjugative relaxase-like TrwC/TraI family protein